MSFSTTITSSLSHHTLFVEQVPVGELLAKLPESQHETVRHYKTFYVVRNWDCAGVVFFYLAKGNPEAPKEVVAWYAKSGSFWSSFGTTLKGAIEGAQRDGWLYA
jgi:hypothetical protein